MNFICRNCKDYIMKSEIVNGICSKTNKNKHIDDECDYYISEKEINFHREVDIKLKKDEK